MEMNDPVNNKWEFDDIFKKSPLIDSNNKNKSPVNNDWEIYVHFHEKPRK